MLSTEKLSLIPIFLKLGVVKLSYTALYRKFRPLTFSEFAGQEHITKTLKNQIIANRVGHAYLFNGGRGTGKTSAAKVLARAVNCLNPKDGEPCNECEICKEILNGSLTDVVEMDAASNNSVEDIRQIRDEVNFLPTKAKYRIYIIDEVHMLSTGAFNALLKTLEEPPSHVKFILATTEPQKLPATILSRCQRFDFKKISNEDIKKRLEIITNEIGVSISKEALNTIAVLSEGAMRDAISILERCIQDGDTEITDEKIKDLVGIPKFEYIYKITNSLLEKDPEKALEVTQEIIDEGKDLYNFLWETIKYIKDVLIFKSKGKLELYSKDEMQKIEELSTKTSKEELFGIIKNLSEIENDIKWSTQKNIMFQTGIIKLTISNESNGDIGKIEKRLDILEKKIESGDIKVNNTKSAEPKQTMSARQTNTSNDKTENKPKASIANITSTEYWPKVVNNLKNKGKLTLFTNLMNTKAVELNDMQIGIVGLTAFGKTVVEQPDNRQEITKAILQEAGKEMQIKVEEVQNVINRTQNQNFGIPINIIEE